MEWPRKSIGRTKKDQTWLGEEYYGPWERETVIGITELSHDPNIEATHMAPRGGQMSGFGLGLEVC